MGSSFGTSVGVVVNLEKDLLRVRELLSFLKR